MLIKSKVKFNFNLEDDDKDNELDFPEPDEGKDNKKEDEEQSDNKEEKDTNDKKDEKKDTPESEPSSQPTSQPKSESSSEPSSQKSQPESPASQPSSSTAKKVSYDNIVNGNSPTIIISAFPTLAKTTYANNHDDVLDLESSVYSKKVDGSKNEEFPKNYVDMIKYHLINNNWRYIFVASHKETRDALKADKIKFYTLYPTLEKKQEVLECCKNRGNTPEFIKLIEENYETWVNEMSQEPNSYGLEPGEFISDELFDTKLKFLKR